MERYAAVRARPAPTLLIAHTNLLVLWSFAFAKPLFDILADSPEFFVARENTAGDIVVLTLAVTLLPPTTLRPDVAQDIGAAGLSSGFSAVAYVGKRREVKRPVAGLRDLRRAGVRAPGAGKRVGARRDGSVASVD